MSKPLAFYDMEVMIPYWCIGIITSNDEEYVFDSESKSLVELEEITKSHVMIGINNYDYDDILLQSINVGKHNPKIIKYISDSIIVGKEKYWSTLDSYDLLIATGVKNTSAKRLASELGLNVLETPVPFDKPTLTKDDKEQLVYYMMNDINIVKVAFNEVYDREGTLLKDKLRIKQFLADTYDINKNWGNNALIKRIFTKPIPRWYNYTILFGKFIKDPKLKIVADKLPIVYDGCVIDFGDGGIHGVHPDVKGKKLKNVHSLDFASLYPNLMILLELFGDNTNILVDLLKKRMELKQAGNDDQKAYKLIINAISGLLDYENSNIYDHNKALSVRYSGQQIALYVVELLVELGCKIINLNTDGVFFTNDDLTMEQINDIIREVYENTNIELEYENFDTFIQKDVNNYVAKKLNPKTNDYEYKCKGKFVKNFNGRSILTKTQPHILDIMLVNKLVNDIEFSDTLAEHKHDLLKFSITLYAGGKFDCTLDEHNNIHQRVNRIIATKDGIKSLVKLKKETGKTIIFPDLPPNFTIINESFDVLDLEELEKHVDWNYYLSLATQKYNLFID